MTVEEFISKKELLDLTNISYGQLYRWKRMNIIPEDWFIKKSSVTGQETYFRRAKILERIELILSMKDDVSLDEIAALFNKEEGEKTVDIEQVIAKEVVSTSAIEIFNNLYSGIKEIDKKELIALAVIEKYLLQSMITIDEMKMIIAMLNESFSKLYKEESNLLLFRKFGISFIVGCNNLDGVVVDSSAIKIIEINLIKEVSEMNLKLV